MSNSKQYDLVVISIDAPFSDNSIERKRRWSKGAVKKKQFYHMTVGQTLGKRPRRL